MIVVDTNIIAYLHLPGEHTAVVEQIYKKNPNWAAPYLWRSELRNVLALNVQRKLISSDFAIDVMERAQQLMLEHEFIVRSYQVLELSFQSGCTAYDCEFVALANDFEVPLITFDKKITRIFPKIAMSANGFLKSNQT